MRKYETEFKLKVVKSFLDEDGGAKLLARQWSVPEEKIRTWVRHYRLHGIDGLGPKRSKYSAQFKLRVSCLPSRKARTCVLPTGADGVGVETLSPIN